MSVPASSLPGLMGIWAHPDDEAFSMGGILARAVRLGYPAAIVCATRGEEGKIAEGTNATQETLGAVREQELRAAGAALGVSDISFLDYIDGHLAEADEHEAVGRIVRQIRRVRPAVVVTFAANGGYGHPDHIAIHRLTLVAIAAAHDPQQYAEQLAAGLQPHRVRKVYYGAMPRSRLLQMREEIRARGGEDFIPGGDAGTIPFEEMGTPDEEITTRVAIGDAEFEAKLQALSAHATQMPADSPFAQATPEQLRQFMGYEPFVLVPPPVSDKLYPTPEDDVFANL
jgi:N-acetyl-1-D-myo-inositol-2-amino-2-deoxy-alpha-D-glucopyranoside deacetylase